MTMDAPVDPVDPEESGSQKRRLLRDRHFWVGAIGAFGAAAGGLAALLALFPGSATVSADQTVTMTVPTTVTETDTVPAATSTSSATTTVTSPGIAASTSKLPGTTTPVAVPDRPAPTATSTTLATPGVAVPDVASPDSGGHAVWSETELRFGSFNLDYRQPRPLDGKNVYRIQEARLYAEDLFQLVEWPTDSRPGWADCFAELGRNGKRDATNLVPRSQVCGRTPEGRIFRIEILDVSVNEIRGQVTVWEK